MFYFKWLIHSLFTLIIITSLSACSPATSTKTTKKNSTESAQKTVKTTPEAKEKTQNKTLINVNQQLDELFTPAIGLF
ncbi:hypothetical protein MNBD_GAMMA03-1945 [hydrothermal vent metagenome]|uniref:Uncharacterized protein n=1 Tax=hydrothermal vent metagenome TaxID=652676 RepID=A0A3B0W9F4_9ZZZZ